MITGMQMITGGVLIMGLGFLIGESAAFHFDQITARSIMAYVYLIFFGSCLGFTSYLWLLQVVPLTYVATHSFVNPIVAVFLGWCFLGEVIDGRILLATFFIVTAVAFINLAGKKSKRHNA